MWVSCQASESSSGAWAPWTAHVKEALFLISLTSDFFWSGTWRLALFLLQERLCLPHHILEERGLVKVGLTVQALLEIPSSKASQLSCLWRGSCRRNWPPCPGLGHPSQAFPLRLEESAQPFALRPVQGSWAGCLKPGCQLTVPWERKKNSYFLFFTKSHKRFGGHRSLFPVGPVLPLSHLSRLLFWRTFLRSLWLHPGSLGDPQLTWNKGAPAQSCEKSFRRGITTGCRPFDGIRGFPGAYGGRRLLKWHLHEKFRHVSFSCTFAK